jgi:mono/diheme cytochrome c family protein
MNAHRVAIFGILGILAQLGPTLFGQANDIVVGDRVVVQRCVIDGPSSRMIAVGFPGGFNYAFDAQNGAPVYVWQGGFIDFSGETLARGGKTVEILGSKQPLGVATVPLRVGDPERLPRTLAFKGYQRSSENGAPRFLVELNGNLVTQWLDVDKTGATQIHLQFAKPEQGDKFYRIDSRIHANSKLSDGLSWYSPSVVKIPKGIEQATITLELKPLQNLFVRENTRLSGPQLYSSYCRACHSVDGTGLIGPSFKGLWGSNREVIRNGTPHTVLADGDYIRESILQPQAALVKGYENVPMPSFENVLSDQDVKALVEYFRESL